MHKILFVCHGNICRSPMAEFVMKKIVKDAGLEDQFLIESAATSSEEVWNGIGNPVYPPAKKKLAEHGISCEGKRAYQMKASDYDKYDYIVVMERRHIRAIERSIHKDTEGKVKLLLSYAGHGVNGDTSRDEVDDPWYSGDFQATWEDVNEGCRGLLEHILAK